MEQKIKAILQDAPLSAADVDTLLAVVDERPTFVWLAAMLLRRCSATLPGERLDRLRALVALGAADRTAMLDLADMSRFDWAHFYPMPKAPEKKSTTDTIDDFIQAYGHSSPEEDRLIERLIFNPVAPDYFQGLDEPVEDLEDLLGAPQPPKGGAAEEPQTPRPPVFRGVQPSTENAPAHNGAPTASVGTHHGASVPAEPTDSVGTHHGASAPAEEPAADSPMLMESLAKIFIKQRRYERALEIISKLSLNNPEKSVYFADQIRFLQKLVYNDHRKNQSQPTHKQQTINIIT